MDVIPFPGKRQTAGRIARLHVTVLVHGRVWGVPVAVAESDSDPVTTASADGLEQLRAVFEHNHWPWDDEAVVVAVEAE